MMYDVVVVVVVVVFCTSLQDQNDVNNLGIIIIVRRGTLAAYFCAATIEMFYCAPDTLRALLLAA